MKSTTMFVVPAPTCSSWDLAKPPTVQVSSSKMDSAPNTNLQRKRKEKEGRVRKKEGSSDPAANMSLLAVHVLDKLAPSPDLTMVTARLTRRQPPDANTLSPSSVNARTKHVKTVSVILTRRQTTC